MILSIDVLSTVFYKKYVKKKPSPSASAFFIFQLVTSQNQHSKEPNTDYLSTPSTSTRVFQDIHYTGRLGLSAAEKTCIVVHDLALLGN